MPNDDIVTRLRASYHASRTCFELLPDEIHDMKQAADVIERLRAEVNIWMGAAERFAESDPKFDAWMYYFKARRGE